MKELITVTVNEQGQQLVSARELYIGLGLDKSNWKRWSVKNITKNDFFKENIDWTGFVIMTNGNETKDFAITLRFAQHICMMARTERSHEYRDYLLECEKQLLSPTRTLRQLKGEALMDIIEAKSVDDRVLAVGKYGDLCKQEAIEEVQPTLDYHDKVLKSDKLVTMTDVAKDLGMSARKLNSLLNDLGVQYKKGKTWHLYSKYEGLVPSHFDYHITEFGQILKVSEEGRKWIINLLEENNVITK